MNNSLLNYFKKSDGTPAKGPLKSQTNTPLGSGKKATPLTKLANSVEKKLKVNDKENASVKKKLIKSEQMDTEEDVTVLDDNKRQDSKKRLSNESLRDDDDAPLKRTKKRRIVIESDSDSETTSGTAKSKEEDEDFKPIKKCESDSDEDMESEQDEDVKPKVTKSKSNKAKSETESGEKVDLASFAADAPKTNLSSDGKKHKLADYSAVNPEVAESGQQMADMRQYKHFKFEHLQDDKIK